jgi:Domain of unknown function (DUF4440)
MTKACATGFLDFTWNDSQCCLMKIAVPTIFIVVIAPFCFAQTPAENDVLQFERDCCHAFQQVDTTTLEKMLTEDFTLTLSNGDVSSRAHEIGELGSGKVHYDIFENANMKVRLYGGDTAVVIGQTHVKGTSDGKPSIAPCNSPIHS